MFERQNVLVAIDKLEGPVRRIIFLGIEFDTVKMTLKLPQQKLDELKALVKTWTRSIV